MEEIARSVKVYNKLTEATIEVKRRLDLFKTEIDQLKMQKHTTRAWHFDSVLNQKIRSLVSPLEARVVFGTLTIVRLCSTWDFGPVANTEPYAVVKPFSNLSAWDRLDTSGDSSVIIRDFLQKAIMYVKCVEDVGVGSVVHTDLNRKQSLMISDIKNAFTCIAAGLGAVKLVHEHVHQRRLAFAMCKHTRLGSSSNSSVMPDDVMELCNQMSEEVNSGEDHL